jgi:hypothetical protein
LIGQLLKRLAAGSSLPHGCSPLLAACSTVGRPRHTPNRRPLLPVYILSASFCAMTCLILPESWAGNNETKKGKDRGQQHQSSKEGPLGDKKKGAATRRPGNGQPVALGTSQTKTPPANAGAATQGERCNATPACKPTGCATAEEVEKLRKMVTGLRQQLGLR